VPVPQAVKTDIRSPSDAELQREILRNRRALFREEAERARRMMGDRELWAREEAALRMSERRRMYRITSGFLGLLLVGIGLFTFVLPDLVGWMQSFSWFPRIGD
jgi:hypothetical protein